jgi:hypothetical protein
MKKLLLVCVCAAIGFTSCENEAQKQSRKTVKELTSYVDSVNKISSDYSDQNWQNIEKGYKEREAKATAEANNMVESDKKEMEESKNKFMDFQTRFQAEKVKYDEKIAQDKKQKMRDDFFGEGKASDLNFAWVDASNITDVYKNFVSKVNDNREAYTKADWDEIKMLMDGLDKRRESLEKTLTNKQKIKISEQKVKFGTIATIK